MTASHGAPGTASPPAPRSRRRQEVALFCAPYLESGQSLVANIERTPRIHSIDDLADQIIAVQRGNTSEPVAEKLLEAERVREVRRYAYHDIGTMLDDLERGVIGAVMKLAPVMHWMTRGRPALRVVQERITNEQLGIAVAMGNDALGDAIDSAQDALRADGTMDTLLKKWINA